MSTNSVPAVGIDLATTYSMIAHLDSTGRPVSIISTEGSFATPSVVLFDDHEVIVGEEAVRAMSVEPTRVAACVKRDMGKRSYHRLINGREYPPEVIQAYIVRRLKQDAERQLGPVERAVITVPAYFDETRRKATQDAGYMAGLEVMDIINEPTAAALAYGFQQGFLDLRGSAASQQRVLVYDLGGGTFDVTILEIAGSEFRALATNGDVQLGGQDWDYRLVDLVAEQFVRQHGFDPRSQIDSLVPLWRNCESAKRSLSARTETTVTCECQGRAQRVKVRREEFERITRDLLDQTNFTARQTLVDAGLTWDDIDRILPVGGSTRMPMVQQMLQQLSGQPLDTTLSVDEAVAHGAALRAGLLLAEHRGQPPACRLVNVNSHSLGLVGTDPLTRQKRTSFLIPRNTPLPASSSQIFRTHRDDQKSVLVQIVEGESPTPEGCVTIGSCVVRGLPPRLPAGTPIVVGFHYAANGRLRVEVEVANSASRAVHDLVRPNSLTQEELDGWRQVICG